MGLDPILSNLLTNFSFSDIIAVVEPLLFYAKNYKKQPENVTNIVARPGRKFAEFTFESISLSKSQPTFNFSAYAEVRFSMNTGTPKNVFAIYSKYDSTVSTSNHAKEHIDVVKLKKHSKINHEYIYTFDHEYIYSSLNRKKIKPFLLFIETKNNLHIGMIIADQTPQFETSNENGGNYFHPRTLFAPQANSIDGYIEEEFEELQNTYNNDIEIQKTILASKKIKKHLNLLML